MKHGGKIGGFIGIDMGFLFWEIHGFLQGTHGGFNGNTIQTKYNWGVKTNIFHNGEFEPYVIHPHFYSSIQMQRKQWGIWTYDCLTKISTAILISELAFSYLSISVFVD